MKFPLFLSFLQRNSLLKSLKAYAFYQTEKKKQQFLTLFLNSEMLVAIRKREIATGVKQFSQGNSGVEYLYLTNESKEQLLAVFTSDKTWKLQQSENSEADKYETFPIAGESLADMLKADGELKIIIDPSGPVMAIFSQSDFITD